MSRREAFQFYSAVSGTVRPVPIQQKPLPNWSIFLNPDPGGIVHTTPPPEWQPPAKYNKRWWRGDIGGVMLPEAPPYVQGANTTPPEMTMSFLLPWYVQFGSKWIDMFLTAHAQRNYSHFLLDRFNCDASGIGVNGTIDLIKILQSWGFFVPMWLTGSTDGGSRASLSGYQNLTDKYMNAIMASSSMMDKFICLPGEELDNGIPPGSPLDNILNYECNRCNPAGIDTYLHFTENVRTWSIDGNEVAWAQKWCNRITGQMWQGNPSNVTNNPPTLGTMQAQFWDARSLWQSVNPNFVMVAGEYAAEAELNGQCSEELACLVGLGLQYATNPEGIQVSGFCNGSRYPNGMWI